MKRFLLYIIVLLAAACTELVEPVGEWGHIDVALRITSGLEAELICDESISDVDTKVGATPYQYETIANEEIKNLWIAQYNGTEDAASLVGEATYISNPAAFLGQGGDVVRLVGSTVDNTLVILANTFDPSMKFPQGSTLADLKMKLRTLSAEENYRFIPTDGTDRYLIFCGSVSGKITGEALTCNLKRNVAKVTVNLINSSDDVIVESVQLRSVPSVSYYVTDYDLPDIYPAISDFSPISYQTVTQKLTKDESLKYITYLPVNKCGVRSQVVNEAYKNEYAPEDATYLEVKAMSGGMPVYYRFYLGANMTTDFNILPNTSYTYTFTINSKGSQEYDARVDEICLRNFAGNDDETANCYIINPYQEGEVLRRFRIPVKRVDEFWGGKNGYEDVPANTLGTDGAWNVAILATNFNNSSQNLKFTKASGTGSYNPATMELEYFEFTVTPGTQGSAIVGLRKGDGPILWSWHLWITNYAPEEAFGKTPQNGVYNYKVTGGYVQRYEGAIWGGEYAGRFIMDRNLGALNVVGSTPDNSNYTNGTGTLYYQYGRKDPLFGNASYGYTEFSGKSASYTAILADNPDDPVATIKYSIYNPLSYIYTPTWGAWSIGNKYNPSQVDVTMLWMDPYTSTEKYLSLAKEKSVFDPCPPGYCVPKDGTWSDFKMQASAAPTTNVGATDVMVRGFLPYDDTEGGNGKGCRYWPYPSSGNANNVPSDYVFYPAKGIIQNDGGAVGSGENVYVQCANLQSAIYTKSFHVTSAGLQSSRTDLGMNLASPVRCITSRDSR